MLLSKLLPQQPASQSLLDALASNDSSKFAPALHSAITENSDSPDLYQNAANFFSKIIPQYAGLKSQLDKEDEGVVGKMMAAPNADIAPNNSQILHGIGEENFWKPLMEEPAQQNGVNFSVSKLPKTDKGTM